MSEQADPDILVHLIHGTWGRGFFPDRFRRNPRAAPRWFETDSTFTRSLQHALGEAGRRAAIEPFLWSGANSVRSRDAAADSLRIAMAAARERFPGAEQVIIAHSHGGNVALRALHKATLDGERDRPRLITLATPFLQILVVDPRLYGSLMSRFAIMLSFSLGSLTNSLGQYLLFDPADGLSLWTVLITAIVAPLLALLLLSLIARPWVAGTEGRDRVLGLSIQSAYAPETTSMYPLLVIRGVDDEALLALTAGALIAKLSRFGAFLASSWGAYILFWFPFAILSLTSAWILLAGWFRGLGLDSVADFFSRTLWGLAGWLPFDRGIAALLELLSAFTFYYPPAVLLLLLLISLAKGVFGRELAIGSFRAEIPAHSVPDTRAHCEVVTLPHHAGKRRFLRHSLYDNRLAVPVIARWLASRSEGGHTAPDGRAAA